MEYLSNCIADFYIRRNIIEPDEKEVYKCGVELILNDVVTFSLILLISAVVWHIRYAIEFLTVFCTTRVHCGGYHAPKAYICRLTMLATFVCVAILSSVSRDAGSAVLYLILAVSFIAILPLIPVKHPNKQLTRQLISKSRKKGIGLYVVYSVCSVLIYTFANGHDGMIIAFSLCAVSALAIIGTFVNGRRC
ncbi:MAG: accessory gene regulator B family protein [Clostridia bacterium]|nr:accessory gene regulator B family protein [Clostridia bacterium]